MIVFSEFTIFIIEGGVYLKQVCQLKGKFALTGEPFIGIHRDKSAVSGRSISKDISASIQIALIVKITKIDKKGIFLAQQWNRSA